MNASKPIHTTHRTAIYLAPAIVSMCLTPIKINVEDYRNGIGKITISCKRNVWTANIVVKKHHVKQTVEYAASMLAPQEFIRKLAPKVAIFSKPGVFTPEYNYLSSIVMTVQFILNNPKCCTRGECQ